MHKAMGSIPSNTHIQAHTHACMKSPAYSRISDSPLLIAAYPELGDVPSEVLLSGNLVGQLTTACSSSSRGSGIPSGFHKY